MDDAGPAQAERSEVMPRAGLAARGLIGLVRTYQVVGSPLLGGHCRFQPTCSHYAIEALRTRGAIVGTWLT